MMSECIFCKIVKSEAPNQQVYQDELVTAFNDRHPAAPIHILIVTNRHITSVNDIKPEDEALVGHMVFVAQKLAAEKGLSSRGYRLVINTGPEAGQSVFHLHMHLLGGAAMRHLFI